jgi:hypothetical protein
MNKKQFLNHVKNHIAKYGIALKIGKGEQINCDGLRLGGYFCEDKAEIRIAKNNKNWFSILAHEYCHFMQWIEKSPVIEEFNKESRFWDDWLFHRKELSPRQLQKKYEVIRNLELDCEKRTVKMIKKFNLPIDTKQYIQNANTYIWLFAYVRDNRKWPKGSLYDKRLVGGMPKKFLVVNRYNKMPPRYQELVDKYCQ